MPPIFKINFYVTALVAALISLWLGQLWQAEKQVRLHSEHFLQQIEKRNWSAAADFVAADYNDHWGHDRKEIVDRLRSVLRFFSSLTIAAGNPQVSADTPAGWWSARVRLDGRGSEYALQIVQRVNQLSEPFVLHWRRQSWRPWDWKLVRVSNPSLDLSSDPY